MSVLCYQSHSQGVSLFSVADISGFDELREVCARAERHSTRSVTDVGSCISRWHWKICWRTPQLLALYYNSRSHNFSPVCSASEPPFLLCNNQLATHCIPTCLLLHALRGSMIIMVLMVRWHLDSLADLWVDCFVFSFWRPYLEQMFLVSGSQLIRIPPHVSSLRIGQPEQRPVSQCRWSTASITAASIPRTHSSRRVWRGQRFERMFMAVTRKRLLGTSSFLSDHTSQDTSSFFNYLSLRLNVFGLEDHTLFKQQ